MKFYLSHAMASALCGVVGMFTFGAVTSAPVGASSTESAAPAVIVTMTHDRFQPGTVHVPAGRQVTWRNTSDIEHTVTGAGFDSGLIKPGGMYTHTFEKAGTFDYHCTPHAGAGMVARVIVDP